MAWTIVQNPIVKINAGGVATNPMRSAAPGTATIAGHSIIVAIWGDGLSGAAIVVTDSAGNTYTIDQSNIPVANQQGAIASCHNAKVVPTGTGWIQVSITGASGTSFWGFLAYEFAPPPSTAGKFDTGASGAATASTTPSSGASGVIAGGDELAVELASYNANGMTATAATVTAWTLAAGDGPIGGIFGAVAWTSLNTSGTVTAAQLTANGTINSACATLAIYKTIASGGLRVPNVPTLPLLPSVGGF